MLALTNPNQNVHRNVVYDSVAANATKNETLGRIAGDVLGHFDLIPLTYNNYFLFSTTTLRGETASVGVLSRVWKVNRDSAAPKK
jgi:hypothetical protein